MFKIGDKVQILEEYKGDFGDYGEHIKDIGVIYRIIDGDIGIEWPDGGTSTIFEDYKLRLIKARPKHYNKVYKIL